MGFVCFFEFSSGPILWLYAAEIMVPKALSLAFLINWVTIIIISLLTQEMIDAMGIKAVFWLYAGLTLIGFIYVWIWIIETKGKTRD